MNFRNSRIRSALRFTAFSISIPYSLMTSCPYLSMIILCLHYKTVSKVHFAFTSAF